MSAIAGIYNFNGAPLDQELLIALGNQLGQRRSDGGREVMFTCVGMSYQAFHTNSESRRETQPLVSSRSQILAWDGRLDNRKDMISQLREDLRSDDTDVAIVMAAYLKWGIEFLPRIIGDFALSLWDPHTRSLLLARDPIGPRTLYYHQNNERIIWSTELRPLLYLIDIDLDINEEYIADYLTRLPDPSQTPYKRIHAVPPASVVLMQHGRLIVQQFWRLKSEPRIRYRTDNEYEEHFRYLFDEAVRCRLRLEGSAWAELSGGLDSSSIVCMADQIIRDGDVQASQLETVSSVFDEAARSDERKYITCVEEKIGKKGHYFREDDYRILKALPYEYAPIIPTPILNFAEYHIALSQAMRERGARVLLSGKGGDEILTSMRDPAPELADLLAQGRLTSLHRRLAVWSEALNKPYARLFWHKAVLPLLSRKLQILCGRGSEYQITQLFDRSFARRMKLDERLLGPEDNVAFYCPVDRYRYLWFSRAVRELAAGFWCELCDVEISYPFTHRPLVEFMFAIPIGQVVRPQESRSLLRRSLSDLLPQKIATRRGKTLNTEALLLAVAREAPRLRKLFANATVCARGYVDSEALLVTLDWASQGGDLRALPLICLGPLEYWLRACESRCFGKDQNRSLSLKPAPMPTVLQTQGFDQVSEAARASWRQALMLPTYVIG